MSNRERAEVLVNELFVTVVRHSGTVLSFRRTVQSGLQHALAEMKFEDEAFIREMLPKIATTDVTAFIERCGAESMAATMADSSIASAIETADAAALVFAHAMLDAAALTACEITMLVAPDTWAHSLRGTPVTLADAAETPYADLLNAAMRRRLGELRYSPLAKKLDHFLARCKPVAGTLSFTDGTKFDLQRIKRLDRLRQRILHDPRLQVESPHFADDLWYLLRIPLLLLQALHARFGLTISPTEVQRLLGVAVRAG